MVVGTPFQFTAPVGHLVCCNQPRARPVDEPTSGMLVFSTGLERSRLNYWKTEDWLVNWKPEPQTGRSEL